MSKILVDALNRKKTDRVPCWFMRQAGRYLPEYREERKKSGGFLDMCYRPEVATKVTLQPVRRFDIDAAIIFSDILVIPDALGQSVHFIEGVGPKLEEFSPKVLRHASIDQMRAHLKPVYEAIKVTKGALPKDKALIGFAGAPWTLACYMIEGKTSKNFEKARRTAIEQTKAFDALIGMLQHYVALHLIEQINAGADVVQIFDSWSGITNVAQFKKYVIAPTQKVVEKVKKVHPDVKIIGFPKDAGVMYSDYVSQTGVDAISVDFHTPLSYKKDKVGDVVIQGNLDPLVLAGDELLMRDDINHKLEVMKGQPFIFNLGHGIVPHTPVNNVEYMVSLVKEFRL